MESANITYKMALCEGRHAIPQATDGYIYPTEVDPLNTEKLEEDALLALSGIKELDLYVTGLTVALIAALNACKRLNIEVTLYHYNRESGDYYPQKVK